ncbi:MAG TPA: hypothetical protein VMB25_18760 [Bryobacteraceae bacterium]|nr:hypothetical protein [Bryobacteraceae bacterium]
MLSLSDTATQIQAAGRWFLESGIQEPSGGIARYYRSDQGQNAPLSTEITGYGVSTLLFLHERTGEAAYRDAALRAAQFLTSVAWDAHLETFPFEVANGPRFAYFFDCGITVRGLLAAWRASGEAGFREVAIAAGRSMLEDFRAAGAIHPILALPEKRPLAYGPRWSARPGCYQLKAAMAWHDLFRATGEDAFLRAYESALDQALAGQREFLPGDPNLEKVMDRLHAYEYFLEGLLPVLDRPACADAFRAGLDRTAGYLREIAPTFERSDVCAQLLRARLLGEARGLPLDEAAAAQEAARIARFQTASGGFLFGRKCGEPMPFVNPVSTAFCVQALALWEDRSAQLDRKTSVI